MTESSRRKKEMLVDNIEGKKVITQKGLTIGKIEDVYVDPETWKVTGLWVKIDGKVLEELGLKKHILRSNYMKIEIAKVSGMADAVVLESTAEELRQIVKGVAGKEEEEKKEGKE